MRARHEGKVMRAILDTDVLVMGVLSQRGAAARLMDGWRAGNFVLCCAAAQRAEVAAVLQRVEVAPFVEPMRAGQFLVDLDQGSEALGRIRLVERCQDPAGNVLLGLAEAGRVDVLVVAEGSELRALGVHGAVKIRSAREFAVMLSTR